MPISIVNKRPKTKQRMNLGRDIGFASIPHTTKRHHDNSSQRQLLVNSDCLCMTLNFLRRNEQMPSPKHATHACALRCAAGKSRAK
jgi:hypothetical protein